PSAPAVAAPQPQPTASNGAALAGLWGAEKIFGPLVRGTLTIDGRTLPWRAAIAGYAIDVRRDGSNVSLALPGGQGSFSGIERFGGIGGTWIQPETTVGGAGYASPVALRRVAPGVWRGDVRPLDDAVSVYLLVSQSADGTVHAMVRNPEANVGFANSFVLDPGASGIAFVDARDSSIALRGAYDAQAQRLDLHVPDFGAISFTRRTRDDAVGFYPATPAVSSWSYRVPLPLDDGWSVGTLASAGVRESDIALLVNRIENAPVETPRSPSVQAVLLARHGKLVLDEYFYGFGPDRPHDLRSASKSFTGLMLGIARDRFGGPSLGAPAMSFFPQYRSVQNDVPAKRQITVGDLAAMNSGLACDDNDDASPGNEDRMYSQTAQTDYYKYALDVPMAARPGDGSAVYCTIGINLLGGIIRDVSHLSLVDFFDRFVAKPLDIREYYLNLMPDGDAYMGGGMYLRPRDALKLGQVYLSGGVWRGRRVVSRAWVDTSSRTHARFPASPFAPGHDYGYTWHLFHPLVGGKVYREYMAQGNGGQIIAVLPDLDATVMLAAGNYQNFPTWRAFFEDWIPRYVIASMVPKT
ncbi:MAG TPA: serine hydrolase domain-containing protein, partial [Candidatus Tumulicola sp.]